MCRRIHDGASSLAWYDPWIPTLPDRKLSALVQSEMELTLLNPSLMKVRKLGISHVFRACSSLPQEIEAIAQISIPSSPGSDSWIWLNQKDGIYSVKSAYMSFITHTDPQSASSLVIDKGVW
jgi:hypothetical protein